MSLGPINDQESVDAVYHYAAVLLRDGTPGPEIERLLREKGLDAEAAATVVRNLGAFGPGLVAAGLKEGSASKGTGLKHMICGGLIFAAGVGVTVFTYEAAAPGGVYIIATGAIVGGLAEFLRGLSKSCGG